jgi:hypothetical protein
VCASLTNLPQNDALGRLSSTAGAIMGKVLFVVLIAVVVWLLFFAKRTLKIRRDGDGAEAPRGIASERMVECMRCGVHIPASEAAELVGARGKYTCVEPERCGNLPR